MTTKATGSPSSAQNEVGDELKALPLADVEKTLDSSADGLGQAEAHDRLARYGPNEIAEHKPNPVLKFLSYFLGSYSVDDRGRRHLARRPS
ncbi:MAG: cation-transporting P-type ATPase [Mycobacterium sp.]|nr:cation-transporting P-type ATPase [Mycobacterium sp.]